MRKRRIGSKNASAYQNARENEKNNCELECM